MKKKPYCDLSNIRPLDLEEVMNRARAALLREGMVEEEKQFLEDIAENPCMAGILSAVKKHVDYGSMLGPSPMQKEGIEER